MALEVFQLRTVTSVLGGEVELAEVLGLPEISALGEDGQRWRAILQAKAKAFLEDSALSPVVSMHRKHRAGGS